MQRPADERLTHDTAREVCERLGVKAMLDGDDRAARAELRADAERDRLPAPATRWPASSASRRAARTCSACSARWPRRMRTRAGRIAAVDQAVRRADRAGDDAVAGGAESVRAGDRRAPQGARAGVGRVLQSGHRAGPRVRGRLHHAVDGVRQPRASGGAARSTRGSPTTARSASANASGCSSPTSTTTASPATRTRRRTTLELWKRSFPRDSRPANALALIHNRFGRFAEGVTEATEALRRSPGHPLPAVEPGVRVSRPRPLRRGESGRRRGGQARRRHGADAAAALSARCR